MSTITVRNLPEATHRTLPVRAAMAGRITVAGVRAILENVARPESRIKLGSLLAEIGREASSIDLIVEQELSVEPLSAVK